MSMGILTMITLWALVVALLFGVGAVVLRCAARPIVDLEDAFTAFWAGWGLIVAVLQIWNLFGPIGATSFWSLLPVAAVGVYFSRSGIGQALRHVRSQLYHLGRHSN